MLAGRISANIKLLREARGWSRPQLGAHMTPPTSGQQVEKLEKGDRRLTVDWIERIAAALHVDPAELITGESQQYVMTEQVADVVAYTLARVALQGGEPSQAIVRDLSSILLELSETFAAHPSVRRDPEQARPVIDLLAKQRVRLFS